MSTDTAAALRSLEIGADALLMAKNNVDGVYDSDPRKNPSAKKFNHLTHHEALSLRLQALDSTALSLCMDNEMTIAVFNIFIKENLGRVLSKENVGTLITASRQFP
jgi:uridylate kinase